MALGSAPAPLLETFFGVPGVDQDDLTHLWQLGGVDNQMDIDSSDNIYVIENSGQSTAKIKKITPGATASIYFAPSGGAGLRYFILRKDGGYMAALIQNAAGVGSSSSVICKMTGLNTYTVLDPARDMHQGFAGVIGFDNYVYAYSTGGGNTVAVRFHPDTPQPSSIFSTLTGYSYPSDSEFDGQYIWVGAQGVGGYQKIDSTGAPVGSALNITYAMVHGTGTGTVNVQDFTLAADGNFYVALLTTTGGVGTAVVGRLTKAGVFTKLYEQTGVPAGRQIVVDSKGSIYLLMVDGASSSTIQKITGGAFCSAPWIQIPDTGTGPTGVDAVAASPLSLQPPLTQGFTTDIITGGAKSHWTSDNNQIAYRLGSYSKHDIGIYSMDVTTRAQSLLFDGTGKPNDYQWDALRLAWTPYGGGTLYIAMGGGAGPSAFWFGKVTGGDIQLIAGQQGTNGITDGTGTAARFNPASSLGADDSGNAYWMQDNGVSFQTGIYSIRKITPGGVVTTIVDGITNGSTYSGFGRGNYFYWATHNASAPDTFNIHKVNSAGDVQTLFFDDVTGWGYINYMWVDEDGDIFANMGPGPVYITVKIHPNGTGAPTITQVCQGQKTWMFGAAGSLFATEVGGFTLDRFTTSVISGGDGGGGEPDTGEPQLSTLTDNFNADTVNAAKWTTLGPVEIEADAAQLGDNVLSGYLRSLKTDYQFDYAQVLVKAAGRGSTPIRIEDESGDWMELVINSSDWTVRAQWYVDGSSGGSDTGFPIEYDFTQHKYFRIKQGASAYVFEVSADGLDWTNVVTHGFPAGSFTAVKAVMIGNLMTSLDNFNILVPVPPEPPDPEFPDIDIPDPSDPDAEAPDTGSPTATQPTCKSVLDWVREFSSGVKQPIRITGPSTIEMVNVNAPLPTGWTNAESPDLYTASAQALTAGEKTLALGSGKLVLTANGQFATNDVRLVTSDWIIPEQLPVYAHHNALVKQVRYSFTPDRFSATVDFHYNPVTPSPGRIS